VRPDRIAGICLAALIFSGCAALNGAAGRGSAAGTHPRRPAAIRALATIRAVGINGASTLAGRATVLAESSGSFRIDVVSPFGTTIAVIIGDPDSLYTYNAGRPRLYSWNSPDLPLPASAAEVASLLMGEYPEQARGAAPLPAGAEVRTTADADGRLSNLVKKVDGNTVLAASLSGYREVSGAVVPFAIAIEGIGWGLKIDYSSVEIDPRIRPEAFDHPQRHEKNPCARH